MSDQHPAANTGAFRELANKWRDCAETTTDPESEPARATWERCAEELEKLVRADVEPAEHILPMIFSRDIEGQYHEVSRESLASWFQPAAVAGHPPAEPSAKEIEMAKFYGEMLAEAREQLHAAHKELQELRVGTPPAEPLDFQQRCEALGAAVVALGLQIGSQENQRAKDWKEAMKRAEKAEAEVDRLRAGVAVPQPSLADLAQFLGWGNMKPSDVYDFVIAREQLLRVAQAELETHKSDAPTAELALRDRINTLKAGVAVPAVPPLTYRMPAEAVSDVVHYETAGLGSDMETVVLYCLECRLRFPQHSPDCRSRLAAALAGVPQEAVPASPPQEQAIAALKQILAHPYGCRFCDSGVLRKPGNPHKQHDDDCGWLLAQAAIEALAGVPSPQEPK